MKYILAIDPGATGAAALVSLDLSDIKTIKSHPSPVQFLEWTRGYEIVEAWEEEVGGLPGDTPHTAFTLGASFGIWQCLARCVNNNELFFIRPKKWQTKFARIMTNGETRYCPSERKERKQWIHDQTKRHFPKGFLYAADAVAIGMWAAITYGDER